MLSRLQAWWAGRQEARRQRLENEQIASKLVAERQAIMVRRIDEVNPRCVCGHRRNVHGQNGCDDLMAPDGLHPLGSRVRCRCVTFIRRPDDDLQTASGGAT